jgi:hypothetical protein
VCVYAYILIIFSLCPESHPATPATLTLQGLGYVMDVLFMFLIPITFNTVCFEGTLLVTDRKVIAR